MKDWNLERWLCKECGSELYYEGLIDSNDEVVVVYDTYAICSDKECINGSEVHRPWHISIEEGSS